jgi:hypothetical protein
LQTGAEQAVQLEHNSGAQLTAAALVGLGRVRKAVAENDLASGAGGRQNFGDGLGAGGEHQRQFGQRGESRRTRIEHQGADAFAGLGAARLARDENAMGGFSYGVIAICALAPAGAGCYSYSSVLAGGRSHQRNRKFGPPVLPVYVQPDCPQPGLIWTPGYWAYGPDGYFWVPGAWVPAPYEGALWTPGYWGWSDGQYIFHEGYWGRHVGYYGGVNYGFGYGGIGFAGGEWRGGDFHYNTAVVHVDRRYIHNTFEDRGRVDRGFVARDSHVAFSGGPGGIRHDPAPEERFAEHDQHVGQDHLPGTA